MKILQFVGAGGVGVGKNQFNVFYGSECKNDRINGCLKREKGFAFFDP